MQGAGEERKIGPKDVLDHMRVEDGLYVLGCLERRVTLYSQQVRALNLVYSLLAEGMVSKGGSIAVVGGGVAGMTAAAGAARLGLRVTLIEERDELLHLIRNNTKRWLHPHIYDWPKPGSEAPDADLPLLKWTAGAAGQVSKQLITAFDELPERSCIDVQLTAEIDVLGHSAPRTITWFAGHDRRNQRGSFDAVILAVGFGIEQSRPGIEVNSYWQDDSLDQFSPSGKARYLISGTGDGGLIDVLRARLRDTSHSTMLTDLVGGPDMLLPVKGQLLAIESQARIEERRQEGGSRGYLMKAYEDLAKNYRDLLRDTVDAQITVRLREGITVFFNGIDETPFSLRASPLNRFLVSRLYFAFDVRYKPFEFDAPVKGPNGFEVQFKTGKPERFDRIIYRHGPRSALEESFPVMWKEHVGKMRDIAVLDQTRWPIYGSAFGPSTRVPDAPRAANAAPAPASSRWTERALDIEQQRRRDSVLAAIYELSGSRAGVAVAIVGVGHLADISWAEIHDAIDALDLDDLLQKSDGRVTLTDAGAALAATLAR
jgi:FAD dependent oxidoreductase